MQTLYFWYDYFSCPQLRHPARVPDETDNLHQARAINSIPAYVARCEVFMALCPVLDCPVERRVLSPATWTSHLLDRVLALGLQASAVVGPFTRGGSKDPGWGRSAAIGMEVFECVLAPASLCRAGDAVSPIAGSLGFACGFLPGSGFAGGWFGPGLRVGWVVLHQQCRLPLHLFRRLSRLLGYAGCRVGEASHPGPGASRAARRKQLQQQQVQQSVQRQVLALLEALVGLLSGGQTNGLPASLRALLQGITSAPGIASPTPKAKAKSRPLPRPKPKAAPKVAPSPPPMPGPTAASPPSAAPAPRSVSVPAATPGPSFALRPADWHGSVLPYRSLADLATRDPSAIVVLCEDAEQVDAAAQLFRAAAKHTALLLHRDPKATMTVPMLSGGKVLIQKVSSLLVETPNVAKPALKSAPAPKSVSASPTKVIRLIAHKPAMPSGLWNMASRNPKAFAQEWAARTLPPDCRSAVKDAWSFSKETRAGADAIVGIARVAEPAFLSCLRCSGEQGVFVEPTGRTMSEPVAITWHKPSDGEDWEKTRTRLLALRPAYGLVLGQRQLGLRDKPQAGQPTRRQWCIAGTPTAWSDEDVQLLVREQTALTDIEVLRRQVRRNLCTWWVRASSLDPSDAHQLIADNGGAEVRLWMLPATARPSKHRAGEAIRSGAPFAYRKDAFEYADRPVPPSTAAQESASTDTGRPEPSTKKAPGVVRVRRTPQGTQLHTVAGDGNCFYSCIAHALQPLDSSLPGPTAAVIRAQTCAHMTKYSESYAKLWDGVDDHGQGMESFHDYIKRMQANGSWAGGLELLACARAHKLCIVMLAERPDLPPCCFNPKPGLPRVALWHTKDHYDLLLPAPPATELPSAVTDLSEETSVRGIPRAGAGRAPSGAASAASVASSAPTSVKLRAKRGSAALREDLPAASGPVQPSLGAPSVASSAPTSLKRARLDFGASASVAPPGPAAVPSPTAGDPASPVPSVAARPSASSGGPSGIRAYFGSSAVPSGPPTGPALPGDTDSQCLSDVEPPPEAPAEPRRVPYGKSGRFRVARSWPCPLCDYKTPTSVKWSEQKRQHISNYHREHAAALYLRKLPPLTRPGPTDTVRWKCPCCELCLLAGAAASYDQAYAVRLRHWEKAHPSEPRERFIVLVPPEVSRSNAARATQAVRAAAQSRRMLDLKAAPGPHTVQHVTLPWYAKPGKQARRTCNRALCTCCGQLEESLKKLNRLPCEPLTATRGPGRQGLRARLAALRDKPDLAEDLRRGLDVVFGVWERLDQAAVSPDPAREHCWDLLAWPDLGMRYICTVCGAVASRPTRAASFACRGMHAWNNRRSKRRRDLTAIAVDGPLHHRAAARRVLEALGFPLPAAAPAGGREP